MNIGPRIAELARHAAEDGGMIAKESLSDAVAFLHSIQATRKPTITLQDNSNLRFRWRNTAGEQIGLQFLGHGLVQYVFFTEPGRLVPRRGRETIQQATLRLKELGLLGLTQKAIEDSKS